MGVNGERRKKEKEGRRRKKEKEKEREWVVAKWERKGRNSFLICFIFYIYLFLKLVYFN